MRIYITSRFKGIENKAEIEDLCKAVKATGLIDFNFIRDVENYRKPFEDPAEL